jgi:preprotein translocase SecE subunit
MSRQLRRHPVASKPTTPKPLRPSLRTPRAVAVTRDGGKRSLSQILRPTWLEGVYSELRKVTWPTWQEAWNLTVVVIVVCIAFGIGLGLLDFAFQGLIQHTIAR